MKKTGALCLCAGAAALPAFLLAPGRAGRGQKKLFAGWNYAHRGLHSRDKRVPENSLEAFRLAALAGYGVELDVQLSKDGQVVVFHDDTLDRVCGVPGKVADRTYDELRQLRLCGTDQTIPLFSQVLELVRGAGPMIVELKRGGRNRELCEKTLALLRGYKGLACVESFDPFIVAWFRFHAPDIVRGQLAMEEKRYEGVSKAAAFLLSRGWLNALTRPHFNAYRIGPKPWSIRFSELLGALRIGWTSHEPRNEKGRDSVIFEYYKPRPKFK